MPMRAPTEEVLLALLGALLVAVGRSDARYAVVVDCGSSGSRAHIFRLTEPLDGSRIATFEPLEDGIKHIRPGLSAVRDDPDAASDYMRPLMDFSARRIPDEDQASTLVYFKGTAGMRLLSDREQRDILDDIARDLKLEYPQFKGLRTEVISGAEEGIDQWLSVNYLAGRLGPECDQSQATFYLQPRAGRRLGMLEIGGASAQVTFEVTPKLDALLRYFLAPQPDALRVYRNSLHELRIKNVTRSLFSATFLGFGSESARHLATDLLVRDYIRMPSQSSPFGLFRSIFYANGSTLMLEDPCLPQGYHDAVWKPTRLLYGAHKSIGYTLKPREERFQLRLVGRGNFALCQALLARVLRLAKQERLMCDRQSNSEQTECTPVLIGTNFVPFRYVPFWGLSEFYYTTKEMIEAAGAFNTPKILLKTMKICATPYDELLARYGSSNRVDQNRVQMQCSKATWMLTWLQFALQKPPDVLTDFTTVASVGGRSISWTLGALIKDELDDD